MIYEISIVFWFYSGKKYEHSVFAVPFPLMVWTGVCRVIEIH